MLYIRHNNDDLTVLDIAVMLNHTRVAHLLMAYGAKESSKCKPCVRMCSAYHVASL